ncbi:MAG: hypothetical protein ACK551_06020 [Vampirovibrionales bacterium]
MISNRGPALGALSIPQFGGSPSPAVAQAPTPSVMPQILGSGKSNNFDTSTLSNVAPKLLTPSDSPQQQALSRQAGMPGGKLNFTC